MHPSYSIIFFTTASGAGYGALFWLGLLIAAGMLPHAPAFAIVSIALALGLVSAGLLASVAHLGRPERAIRAFSQWRSSWLSREGVAAMATYIPTLGFLAIWAIAGAPIATARALGLLSALMACGTVACTAMIYASLAPVRQWHNGFTLPNYLLMSLYSGAVVLAAVGAFWRAAMLPAFLALAAGAIALTLKILYWRHIDTEQRVLTPADATGLGRFGRVRQLEPPHVEENFLLREMGFQLARKHASRLRRLAIVIGFLLPAVLQIVVLVAPVIVSVTAGTIAAILAVCGLIIERWLFFGEATHTVTLYYGRTA